VSTFETIAVCLGMEQRVRPLLGLQLEAVKELDLEASQAPGQRGGQDIEDRGLEGTVVSPGSERTPPPPFLDPIERSIADRGRSLGGEDAERDLEGVPHHARALFRARTSA
jgi:hypothetical protein